MPRAVQDLVGYAEAVAVGGALAVLLRKSNPLAHGLLTGVLVGGLYLARRDLRGERESREWAFGQWVGAMDAKCAAGGCPAATQRTDGPDGA